MLTQNLQMKTIPRFNVGDWVSFLYGFRRVLGQVVEDRGPLGRQGRRLYQLDIDLGRDESTIEIPEDDLEPAPEIATAEVARKNGFSTQNWPRQTFQVTYVRSNRTNGWRVSLKPTLRLRGVTSTGAVASATARYASESPDDERFEIVTVLLEYDPRLDDPQSDPDVWSSLTADARRLADEMFKARHPKAVVER